MLSMRISCEHIAANSTPKPHVLTFLTADLLVYAFSDQVALYSLSQSLTLLNINDRTLEHGRINCIASHRCLQQWYLLIGDDNGNFLIFQSHNLLDWRKRQSFKQSNSLMIINILPLNDSFQVCTNNNGNQVTCYSLAAEGLQEQQTLKFPLNRMMECLCQASIEDFIVLFAAGVDQKIHCYTKNKTNNSKFAYQCALIGHENAVTRLAFAAKQNQFLLASCSKEGYIRLWRITNNLQIVKFHKNVYQLSSNWNVFLESVLVSHECAVTGLCWSSFDGLQLVSCSLDCTICIWGLAEDGTYEVKSRMGQLLGNKNAYFDVVCNETNEYLAALNYTGAVLLWHYSDKQYTLRESFNGHSGSVKDIEWNHTGDFLVSVSKDQTTRVLARKHGGNYYEISRAQVHGYDINAVTVIKVRDNTLDVIVCGADQKVIRVVEPSACFANYLNSFTQANLHLFFNSKEEEEKYLISKPEDKILQYETFTEGGTQVLGLMTKMQRVEREVISSYYADEQNEEVEQQQIAPGEVKLDFTHPPHEDYLIKHTLWPEMNKLYAHPHEIQCLCRNSTGLLMASSCSALNKQAASIVVWDTRSWKVFKVLTHHSYTVFSMQFSKTDRYFGSVSKDRKLGVFTGDFELIFSYEAHSRAITSISFDSQEKYVATGSRDKTIKLHCLQRKQPVLELDMKTPVTALQFSQSNSLKDILAFGGGDGTVSLLKMANGALTVIVSVADIYSHTSNVNALKWNRDHLASCGDDGSVRVYRVWPE